MSRTSKLILGVQDLSIKPLNNPRLTRLLISHPVDPACPVGPKDRTGVHPVK